MTEPTSRPGETKEDTQPTQPKKGKPVEIPIPTRDAVLHDLMRVAKPDSGDERKQR